MYELTYYSIAKRNIGTAEISDILAKARDFNSKNDITGCLLFHNNQFIQVLEGDKNIITDLLLKIGKDERHFNIIKLAEAEKDERTFKGWTMAYRELSEDNMNDINDSLFENNFFTFSELADKPTRVIRLFWTRAQRLLIENYSK